MTNDSIGTRVREARKARGWSLEQLAVYANLSVKTVWTAETGKKPISTKTLRELGKALDLKFFEQEQVS